MFEVEIASVNGNSFRYLNNVTIQAHKSIFDIEETDVVIIPSIGGNILKVMEERKSKYHFLSSGEVIEGRSHCQ